MISPNSDPRVGVIVPTWNEAATIADALTSLRAQSPDEIIVADGGSPDDTRAIAESLGIKVVVSPLGRGAQQNRAAEIATGDVFLFLHADCRLAPGAILELKRFAHRHPFVPGGCFRMKVDHRDVRFRLIEAAGHLRAGVFGLPYGDQGIFIPRWAFDRVGGFPETRLMDDLLIAKRLRRLGRLALLRLTIAVSPRRWLRRGIVRQTLLNLKLAALLSRGVPADDLARLYPPVR